MLRDADTAMYRAKARGRARCELFDAEMRTKVLERLTLEEDLRRALENNELVAYYQPKVSLTTGRVVGFEALARWQDPVRGLRLPSEFIPLAEETGLIVPIGRWILREACQQTQRWHQCYPHQALTISVNVSLNQFKQPGLVEEVTDILKETGLAPGTLQLELTESVLMEDPEAAIEVLGQLRAMQVSLKIDDFGTGYSSLNYVHRLPVDILRVYCSFVANMMDSNESNEIIKTIVALAKNLHKELIAEGIESEEQAARLRSLGCDYGQGFDFASAMDALSAEAYFVERSVAEVA